jgi:hypothetical protein
MELGVDFGMDLGRTRSARQAAGRFERITGEARDGSEDAAFANVRFVVGVLRRGYGAGIVAQEKLRQCHH